MNRVTGLLAVLFLLFPGIISAQEFSVSPYSIFGIGDIQMSDGGRLAGMAVSSFLPSLAVRYFSTSSVPVKSEVVTAPLRVYVSPAGSSHFSGLTVTEKFFDMVLMFSGKRE